MESKVTWRPPPDESSSAELPDFLRPLIEALAEKIHNRWAAKRLEEGWSYGPERNDKLRTTPNLVDYGSLPEIEKEYDRATAIATLKNLYADGYRIVHGTDDAPVDAGEAEAVAARLQSKEQVRFEDADLLWRGHTQEFWGAHPELLLALAKKCSDAGWPLLAFDMASRALASGGKALPAPLEDKLRHIAVLSLMEVGALEKAAGELAKIRSDEWIEGDLHGLRGRLSKARGLRAKDAEEAARHFQEARDIYRSAYGKTRERFLSTKEKTDGAEAYYLGINAATMSAWAGLGDEARSLAAQVLETCTALSGETTDPWLEATRGEAHLLRGEMSEATEAYRRAGSVLRGQWRPLQSMRRQALETAKRTGLAREEVEQWFDMPALCARGFAEKDGPTPPGSIVFYYLRDASRLSEAAAICATSAEFHLCLGQAHDAFVAGLTESQAQQFAALVGECTRVLGKEEQALAGEASLAALAPLLFRGAILLRAQELDVTPKGLPSLAECVPSGPVTLRALLCADAKGYSRLDNELLKVFVKEFLGCIGAVVEKFRDRTLTVKTAGDGLFMVFRDLASAVAFSLALRNATCAIDWAARGMPDDLGLRISLDAGPMLEFTDPVTGNTDVAGRLVNRAARIEPITPVNHVYASRTLAALALAMEIPGVRFEYAGETPLPKGFGAFQLYHLTAA
ncbi:MAG: RyR domain-containing protein [Chthoniobacterales bacterium]